MRERREIGSEKLRKFEKCLKRNERDLRFTEEESNGDGMKIEWTSFVCPECRIHFESTSRLLDHIMPCQFSKTIAERYRLLGIIVDDAEKIIKQAEKTRLKTSILEQSFTDVPSLKMTVPMSSELAAYFQHGLEIHTNGNFQEYIEFRTKIDGKWYDLRFVERTGQNREGTLTSNVPINGSVSNVIVLSSDDEAEIPDTLSPDPIPDSQDKESSPLISPMRHHNNVLVSSSESESEDDEDAANRAMVISESEEDRIKNTPRRSAARHRRNTSESEESLRRELRSSARKSATRRKATLRRSQRGNSSDSEEDRRETRSSARKTASPRNSILRRSAEQSLLEPAEEEMAKSKELRALFGIRKRKRRDSESDENRRMPRPFPRRTGKTAPPRNTRISEYRKSSSSESEEEEEESDDNRRKLRSANRRPATPRSSTLRQRRRIESSDSEEEKEPDRRETRSRKRSTPFNTIELGTREANREEQNGDGNVSSNDEAPRKRRKVQGITGNFDDLLKQCQEYDLTVPDIITFGKTRDRRDTSDLAQALGLSKAPRYWQFQILPAMRRKFNLGNEDSDDDYEDDDVNRRYLRRSERVETTNKSTKTTRRNTYV